MKPMLIDVSTYTVDQCIPTYQAGFIVDSVVISDHYTIDVAIWFPTEQAEQSYHYLPHLQGKVMRDAMLANGKFPLVAISSGYAGTMYDQAYLAEYLARQGYVVLSVSHTQFDTGENLGCGRAWHRAHEIKQSIDFMCEAFSSVLCDHTVSLIGFSAGAFSALLLAGAVPDFELDKTFQPYLNHIETVDFSSLRDERIKHIGLFAPALSSVFHPDELRNIKHDILLITAEKDDVLADTTQHYRRCLPNIVVDKVIKNAGHFIFNAVTSPLMQKLSPDNCVDIGIDRSLVHAFLQTEVLSFLQHHAAVCPKKAITKQHHCLDKE